MANSESDFNENLKFKKSFEINYIDNIINIIIDQVKIIIRKKNVFIDHTGVREK